MASKTISSTSLLLSLNLLFAFASGQFCYSCPGTGGGNNNGNGYGSGSGSGNGNGNGGGGGNNNGRCPRNALQLSVCVSLLNGLLGVVVGTQPTRPCCTLLAGLLDLDAAICLCTALRANVLGIVNLNLPLSLTLLLNACGRSMPANFVCPNN